MRVRDVQFDSQGILLLGKLYEPANAEEGGAGVVMAHGLSATIEGMMADRYAEVLCGAGLVVLLYDHPYLGRSEGEPRQRISAWRQARGYIDALTFLGRQDCVDPTRMALWGDSLSAGEAIAVAAVDKRVSALVVQVPSCGRAAPPDGLDPQAYLRAVRDALEADFAMEGFTAGAEAPVVSSDQGKVKSLLEPSTAFRWFMEFGSRAGTNWRNWGARAEPAGAPHLYPVLCAQAVFAPSLFVVARDDEMPGSKPKVALMAFECMQGPKELLEVSGGHFGLLYPGEVFEQVSAAQASFLLRQIGASARRSVFATRDLSFQRGLLDSR
jgi:dienelactone hydrolase